MKALTASEMREVDRLTSERFALPGTQLMEHAGAAVARTVSRLVSARGLAVHRIVVLCGKGNNGGDGFVAARHLRPEFHHIAVILFAPPSELRGDAALNFERWRDTGGEVNLVQSVTVTFEQLDRFPAQAENLITICRLNDS